MSVSECVAWLTWFFFGIAAGSAMTAGVFAFLMKIGIYPRMIGGIYSVYPQLTLPLGGWFVVLWGMCAGIYVGCVAAALSEVLNVFPVLFRRLKVDRGIPFFMLMMAGGKMCGALWYFWHGLKP